uniref:GDP-fucose protein O-fucosyltransferase 1 n=1 Tax=Globodera pallida TaxID=36090 RepID=A0A183BZB5_GLOPA
MQIHCHFPSVFFVSPLFLVLLSLPFSPNAFVLFCPCTGRFGNQMEQFLGVFAFAKLLNRTLVLPPIINYPPGVRKATLGQFHRIVLLRDFMRGIATKIWPMERRKVLCWSPRPGLAARSELGCHATEGNPSGPFWRHVGTDFVGEEYFGERTGGFDVAKDSQFVQWNGQIEQNAREFVVRKFGHGKAFVAIHLRNDRDWENVCQLLREEKSPMGSRRRELFASAQCTGSDEEYGQLTVEACNPSLDNILEEIYFHVLRLSAAGVFVASDRNHHLAQIGAHLAKSVRWSVTVTGWAEGNVGSSGGRGNVPVELALLGMADHFIANCVSTFSAFVVRQRHFGLSHTQKHRSVTFLAFPNAAMELLPEGSGQQKKAGTVIAGGDEL